MFFSFFYGGLFKGLKASNFVCLYLQLKNFTFFNKQKKRFIYIYNK